MKCLFPIYPESWICPQPLVPVCVIAIHHLSYENARGINPNLNQRFPSNCLLFVRRENANAPANKGILFSAGLCLHLIYSFFTHSCYTNNLTVPCMSVRDKTEAWRAIREPIQHVRAANETCIWTGFRVWWWWMHCAPGLQLNKEPLAQRQASADIPLKPWPYSCMHWISLWHPRLSPSPHPVSPPTPSVALPCRLHSLCNHVLSPSDEKLISIHSYQREASSHCWHRWDCCVCSLCFWGHALERRRERERVWCSSSYGERSKIIQTSEWGGAFSLILCSFVCQTAQIRENISSIFYWRHCQQVRFMLSERVSWFHRI